MNDDIYTSWKTLRNLLSKVDAKESLEALRYYSLFSPTGDVPPQPPDYVDVHGSIFKENCGIFPWDVETLAREVILSSDDNLTRPSLKEWRFAHRAFNNLKRLDETIARVSIDQTNVLDEFFRLQHRQFKYQVDTLTRGVIARYSRLFSYKDVLPIFEKKLSMSPDEVLTIGFMLWGLFSTHAAVWELEEEISILGVGKDNFGKFMKIFSRDFLDLKKIVKDLHSVDDAFLYQFNPVSGVPLVRFKREGRVSYVCPSTAALQLKFTRGIYYELCREKGFDNAFGSSFERYVGDVSEKTLEKTSSKVFGEEVDRASGKRRCDWVIDQKKSFTLVECKTKRLSIGGYISLSNRDELDKQIGILAEAVVQTYECLTQYRGAGYTPPVYPYSSRKQASICVVTLERWYLSGENLVALRREVEAKLKIKGIKSKILKEAPFCVMSIEDYERFVFLAKSMDVYDIIAGHNDIKNEDHEWEFSSYLANRYKGELGGYDFIFGSEMDSVFTKEAVSAIEKSLL